MKYVPKSLHGRGNVNVSTKNPLREFLWLLGTVFALFAAAYVVLGFAAELLIVRFEPQITDALAAMSRRAFIVEQDELSAGTKAREEQLRQILAKLVGKLPEEHHGEYRLVVDNRPMVNAVALPGRIIVVYRGLVELIASENEVAMVLAHELGHFAHKDHLRGIGRGVVFIAISALLLGEGSGITQAVGRSLNALHQKFSRDQESAADEFALDLLQAVYGHVGGAEDFFARLSKKENDSLMALFIASHPVSSSRVKRLREIAREKGYPQKELLPF